MTNLLSDVITYVRRLVKTPSNAVITDSLIIDYINRFWLMDVDARLQLFDLKTTYQFQTVPGVDQYNMPLYDKQTQILSQTETQIVLNVEPFTDGTALYFEDLLSGFRQSNPTITLKPDTVEVYIDKGNVNQSVYLDDGAGTMNQISGTYTISSGTIDYNTGNIILNFTVSPVAGISVLASFVYISTQFGESVDLFPVYQGFFGPAYVNGVEMPFYTQRSHFFNLWPSYNQTLVQVGTGDGTNGPYTFTFRFLQNNTILNNQISSTMLRGHVDITGIISTGNNIDPPLDPAGFGTLIPTIPSTSIIPAVYFTSTASDGSNAIISDTGIFLQSNQNYGLLMTPGTAPYGNTVLVGSSSPNYTTTQNTINYTTGVATNVFFDKAIPNGMPINGQAVFYQTGIPRACLFYNNVITLRAPPNTQYLIQLDAYLTPAAFFNTSSAIPFGYMAEYIARGAARKILSDIGDWEQFGMYEPLFKEQEMLVWKRSQRQFTATRTQTIYSNDGFPNTYNNSSIGL